MAQAGKKGSMLLVVKSRTVPYEQVLDAQSSIRSVGANLLPAVRRRSFWSTLTSATQGFLSSG